MFGNDLVRFGPVRFGKKNSGSVRFGGSVKILVRSNTSLVGCGEVYLVVIASKSSESFEIHFWGLFLFQFGHHFYKKRGPYVRRL